MQPSKIASRHSKHEGLIKLRKQAAPPPARDELVMALQQREWQLTWKCLKALKSAGLCASCVSDIIDSIDVVAAAPSNKRHNLEAALNAAVAAAGAAVKNDLHKVTERVWLCPQAFIEFPERTEADRSSSNAIHMQRRAALPDTFRRGAHRKRFNRVEEPRDLGGV
jgi:hypothetical protein